jgi:excisionase family DNA binding protein
MSDRRSLWTAGEVAEFLQVPVRTLERWRYVGAGPRWVPMGRHVRYRWDDVEAWLEAQAAKTAA